RRLAEIVDELVGGDAEVPKIRRREARRGGGGRRGLRRARNEIVRGALVGTRRGHLRKERRARFVGPRGGGVGLRASDAELRLLAQRGLDRLLQRERPTRERRGLEQEQRRDEK